MAWWQAPFIGFLTAVFVLTAGQATNSPPSWVQSSVEVFPQGFSEATPVGTVLAILECTDPENDPISYKLRSGNAVIVTSDGKAILNSPLDYEQPDQLGYDLAFTCVDMGTDGFPLHTPVEYRTQISVNDANDNAPIFEVDNPDGYAFFTSEATPPGTLVEDRIKTTDIDRGRNAELLDMYLICNSKNQTELASIPESSKAFCTKFRLEYNQTNEEGNYQAYIYTTGVLDYETRPVYSSKIIAIDGPGLAFRFTTTVNVQINIEDAQDSDPFFTNPAATTTVSEGVKTGDILNFNISARDGDTGIAARRPVALTIINDTKNAFNLTQAIPGPDGIYHSSLIVKTPLDRETNLGAYKFVVKVTELDKNTSQPTTATATATYSVFVSDINDNAPTFSERVYRIEVTEMNSNATNESVQITGLHIVCSDLDEPSNAQYNVTVVSQTLGNGQAIQAYSVSPGLSFTGTASMFLKVDNPMYLDYDIPDYRTQTVVLVAREINTRERLSSSTTISIILQDINDNSPQFSQQAYVFSIPETTEAPIDFCNITGITSCQIIATDRDSGRNGQLKYRLEGDFQKFQIDEDTGVLRLVEDLDYEVTSQYVFLVYATDEAVQPRSNQVQVTIDVINVNDEKPVFNQAVYRTSVNESSTRFLNPVQVKATDNEVGTVAITYRLLPGNYPADAFAMDPQTGNLTLLKTLNFELTQKDLNGNPTGIFILRVEASDNGQPPQTSQAEIRVTVIDQNNHAPVLSQTTFFKTIPEIAPAGTIVANITGTDADGGDNGKINYRLGAGASDSFVVDSETGLVTVGSTQSFDFDRQRSYVLLIIATDGGAPQKSATATISVDITDSNNKDPVFGKNFYQESVDESEPVGFVVLTAVATDADSTASLRYSIVRSTIRAIDASGNSMTNTSPYDFTQAFDVNQNGGIYIKNKLEKDYVQEIRFTLNVTDLKTEKGLGSALTQVTIIITGAVDARITFDTITQVFMNEDAPLGYIPVRVTARDPSNRPVENYYNMTYSPYFNVQSNGALVVTKSIDFETDTQPNHEHFVVVGATSIDLAQTASTTVTIMVVDVNDNNPEFEEISYEAEVMEDARYPTPVLNIFATDADSSSYGPLDFRISGGLNSDDFEIFLEPVPPSSTVSRRAQILVAQGVELDYTKRRQYDLDLIVGDNAALKFSSKRNYNRAKLTIKVIDVNNHAPKFKETEDYRRLAIPETATLDQSIATIVATDEDVGANGDIRYTLEAGGRTGGTEGLKLFRISPELGIVSVSSSLLGKGNQVYYLVVRASDRGDIPLSSTMRLEILVLSTEDNDGNPKWLSPENGFTVTAPEETPGYVLRDNNNNTRFFVATPRNGTNITYSLSQVGAHAKDFKINRLTGEITVEGSLDREVQEIYELLVYAEDTIDPINVRTGRLIRVRLLDKDDTDATFNNEYNYPGCPRLDNPYIVRVWENTPLNVTVDTLKACDPDSPENAQIYYSLYNGNADCTAWNLDSGLRIASDGRLVTRKIIDYEQDKMYKMCVKAEKPPGSSGRKKREAWIAPNVIQVNIIVLDVNDNSPKFSSPTSTGVVTTDPGIGPVVPLTAIDPDGPGRNVIVYTIEDSLFYPSGKSEPSARVQAFTLRGGKAALYPALPSFEQFAGGRFEVTLVATDGLDSTLRSSQKITIYVYEKNQALRAVMDIKSVEGFTRGEMLIKRLDEVDDKYFYSFISMSEHRTQDSIDPTMTDVCFLAVDIEANRILGLREVEDVLDTSAYEDLQDSYNVVDTKQCYPSESSEDRVRWRDLWWLLVALAIFIFVCCLILIILVFILYDRYKSYMETRKTYLVTQ